MKIHQVKLRLSGAIAILIAAVTFVACSNDEVATGDSATETLETTVTFTACYPGYDDNADAKTRIGYDKGGSGYWQEGDVIGVWSVTDGKFKPFKIESGAGTGKATFTGKMKGKIANFAVTVYPYTEGQCISGDSLSFHLADTYTYTGVDKDYYSTDSAGNVVANINSFNMPLIGNVVDSKDSKGNRVVKFYNAGGVALIKIDSIPETGIVTVTADTAICGDFRLYASDMSFDHVSPAEEGKTVKFNYSGAEKFQSGVFCVPLFAGKYALTVSIDGFNTTSDGTGKIQYKYSKTFDSFTLEQSHLKRLAMKNVYSNYEIYVNGHRFIDLGLPSGLLWAEVNLGATVPGDYGNYYAWGYTEPITSTKPSRYDCNKFGIYDYNAVNSGFTKYNDTDGKKVLDPEDDAATVNWGVPCRMPSPDECHDIMYFYNGSTTNQWIRAYDSEGNSVNGVDIKSKANGHTLYIPASGYYYHNGGTEINRRAYLRTNSISAINSALAPSVYQASSGKAQMDVSGRTPRWYGFCIRAVVQP